MVRVVHHAEAGARHGEPDGDGQQHHLPRAHVRKHQDRPGADEPGEEHSSLEAHPPAPVGRLAGALEVRGDPLLQVCVERTGRGEMNSLCLCAHGRKGTSLGVTAWSQLA